jgi:outer membrane protein TolC
MMMARKKILLLPFLFIACALAAQTRNLDYYIQQSIKNSPLIKDYHLQMASNGIDSQKVKATFKPQVGLNGQIYYAPNYNGYGYDNTVTNGGNYQAQVAATQELIIRKSKHVQLQGLDIQNQYLDNSSKITELDLTKAVTDEYIIAFKDFNLIRSVQEILDLLSNEEESLKPLVQKGLYAQTDYLNIRMTKEAQLLALRQAQMQYKNDLYSLNVLCGLEDTIFPELAKPSINLTERVNAANLLLLKQYRIDSLKFMNRKKTIDLNYQPKLSAFADAGLWSAYLPGIYKNFGAGVGLNFSMPLYDGKQRKYEYQKIALASQISHNYEDFYHRQYQQQILQLEAQLKATDDLIAETNKQIQLSKDLIDVYKAELNQGLVRVTDLILTVNNYINFKTSLNQANMSSLQIINQLNYFK